MLYTSSNLFDSMNLVKLSISGFIVSCCTQFIAHSFDLILIMSEVYKQRNTFGLFPNSK